MLTPQIIWDIITHKHINNNTIYTVERGEVVEPETRKLVKYILVEFAIFLILVFILFYITSYFNLDFRIDEIRQSIIDMWPLIVGIVLIIIITKLILSLLRPAFDRAFEGHMRSHAEVKMIWRLIANIVWIFIIIFLLSCSTTPF